MVLLVTPNTKKIAYGLTSTEFSAIQPNIYMNILESVYNHIKKIPCKSIHMEADQVDISSLIKYIKVMKPSKVGIICSGSNPSASTMTMPATIEICQAIKREIPSQFIFIWGGHPTVLPDRTKFETGADQVIVGTDFGCSVSDIPRIDWKRIDPTKYRAHNWHCFGDLSNRSPYAVIWTSLGCPYQCEFCCVNNIFGRNCYMQRPIYDVIKEIDFLVKNYDVHNIKIMDELFVSNNYKRLLDFCDALIRRRYNLNLWCFARVDTVNPKILGLLKKAGVNWIAYGFESMNQKIVNAYRKGTKIRTYEEVIKWTHDAGMFIIADFIAGFWEDDYTTLEEMYSFMCRINFEFINLYPLFAYPGTTLYKKYIDLGRIQEPHDWREYVLYGEDCKPCPTCKLTSAEVLVWRDSKYIEYYKRPEYLSMIEEKFGIETHNHVNHMADMKLRRNICTTLV